MKKTYKYIISALLVAGSLAACSPEEFDGVNENGIPQASEYSDMVTITVDQSINQATFKIGAKEVYGIWTINTGKKEIVKSGSEFQQIFTTAGDYTVTVKLGNRNGISDGTITKTFHIDNSIVDFSKYVTMISKAPWYIDNTAKGHMACGPNETDPVSWWSGDPDCKKNEGVYDNCLTFSNEMKYTFDPGNAGTIYVNKGVTIWPDYRDENNDFNVPVEKQETTYNFEVDGDDLYLTFPANTYFPYIAFNDSYTAPRYQVVSMTTKAMTLWAHTEGISWQFILSTSHEVAFNGFDVNSPDNVWKQANAVFGSLYYAHGGGWEGLPDYEHSEENGVYTVKLPTASDQQWQAQYCLQTELNSNIIVPGTKYDFSCKIYSTTNLPGVTLKLTSQTDDPSLINNQGGPLAVIPALEETVVYFTECEAPTIDGNYKFVFDFGGNPDNSEITIKDICIIDHSKNTITPPAAGGDDPEVGPTVDWSGANLLAGMPIEITQWYADASWSQYADAEYTAANGVYTINYTQANEAQWQGQFTFNNTGITLDPQKHYDFRVKLTASNDHPGVTVKLTQQDNDDIYLTADRHALTAFEDTWVELGDLQLNKEGEITNLKIVYDFGGVAAGTTITVSDMHLQEHKEGAAGGQSWNGANLLAGMTEEITQWYANAGWAQYPDAEYTAANGVYTINYTEANEAQWQGQFTFNNTGVALDPSKHYDFRVKLTASNDHPGVTVKLTQQDNDDIYLTADRHALSAYEETWIELTDLQLNKEGEITNLKIVYDFGGVVAGTEVVISDMHLQEHIAGGGSNGGGTTWVDANSADNLLNGGTLALASTWFANDSWAELGNQPTVEINGRDVKVTVNEANGGSQWQGQVHLNTSVAIEEGKTYDFAIVMTPSQNIGGATVKPHPEGDDAHFFSEGRHDLAEYEDNLVTIEKFTADFSTSNLVLTLDFPGCAAGAEISVTGIIIQEHK